jgi:glycosyltransferase involved in cell wall biosynthesis
MNLAVPEAGRRAGARPRAEAPARNATRRRILFIIDWFHRTGGTEKHLAQLAAGLKAFAFDATVVVFDRGDNPLLEGMVAAGVPVIHLPVGREYVPNALVQAWRLSRLIRAQRYDIVQTYHQKADTYGALIARAAGVRHLVSSKRDTGQLRKPLHTFLNRRLGGLFQAIIMAADGVRAAVAARDRLSAGARIVTIYNGVDTHKFRPPEVAERAAARARLGFGEEDFVVGMIAGLRPEKNHDVLLAALAQLAPEVPRLRVLLVGAGPLLEHYREQVAHGALAARALFTGDVAQVRDYAWAMDVGCLTPGSNEGFSNAVIEQMATGLPMIVTDVGGNAEAVAEGESGYVIAPGASAALAKALRRLYQDAPLRAAMGRAARARVEERFSLDEMCARHAQLYRALIEEAQVGDE